jgi:hypothetical protein
VALVDMTSGGRRRGLGRAVPEGVGVVLDPAPASGIRRTGGVRNKGRTRMD